MYLQTPRFTTEALHFNGRRATNAPRKPQCRIKGYNMVREEKHPNSQFGSTGLGLLVRGALPCLLCSFLVFQPLTLRAQEITAAQNVATSTLPSVGAAENGVPLVDVVAPNAAGLSHNLYDRFNVGQQGAILNNSNQGLQPSQLGGMVNGNPNLNDSVPASVILNEVVSSSRSLLEGSLEVHGDSANVIVANPNGVACDGCGFINTPRVGLSTDRPSWTTMGRSQDPSLEQANIDVAPSDTGLDGISAFDLLTRKIRISDGDSVEIADDHSVVVGRNSHAYRSGLITPVDSYGGESGVAIDSSLISGMYPGQIKIISTDRGSGVNMQGGMASGAHDMIITADGKIKVRNNNAED